MTENADNDRTVDALNFDVVQKRLTKINEAIADLAVEGIDALVTQGGPLLLGGAQSAMTQSEARYRYLINRISAIVVELTPTGEVAYINEAITSITGFSVEEIMGRNWFDLLLPIDESTSFDTLRLQFFENGELRAFMTGIRTLDASRKVLSWSSANVYDADGMIERLIFFGTDVTEKVITEQKLAKSERHFRSLFASMLEGYAYCKMIYAGNAAVDWIYLDVNPAFGSLTGLRNVVGKPVSEVIPGLRESNPELFEIYGRVALTGQPERFETYVDALKAWFSISVYCPKIDHFVAVFDNINVRKADEARILRLTQLYAALSLCNESILLCDNEAELFPQICQAVAQHGGIKMAWIGLIDESGKQIKPVASYGEGTDYLQDLQLSLEADDPYGRGPAGTSVRENRPIWCQDFLHNPATAPWHESAAKHGWRSAASLTLLRKKEVVGCLVLYADTANAFDEEARKLLLEMAANTSFAMSNFAYAAERKQAERQLRESELRYKRITEGLTDYQYTVFVENGRAVENRQSPGCKIVTGYTPEDFAVDPYLWIRIVQPEHRDLIRDRTQQILAGKDVPPVQYRIMHKDGTARWVSDTSILFKNATGELLSYDGVIKDITQHKAAEEQIQRYIAQLKSSFMHTVEVTTTLIEMRDPYTAGHERRVSEIAAAIGIEMGWDAQRVEGLRISGLLHDIGKIRIPAEILAKPGRITPAEYTLIKEHAQAGYDALKVVEFPWPVAAVAGQHHERMDGSGYPRGLKGDEILPEARIMMVADVVEAMASHRPYRPGQGIDKALDEIERGIGSAYDKDVAEACLRLFREKGYLRPL